MSNKPLIYLFLSVAVIAFFTSHATLSIDPPNRYLVAKSLVDYGDLQIRPLANEVVPPGLIRGVDGNWYSHFGVGQALIFAGPYWVFHHVLGIESDKIIRSLISITLFPVTLALTAMAFYALIREFGFSMRHGYLAAMLLIFATGLWQVSKEGQEDCHLALCFAVAALGLRRFQKGRSFGWLAIAAAMMGFAFLIRSDIASTIVCFLALSFWIIHVRSRVDNAGSVHASSRFVGYLIVIGLMAPVLVIHCLIYYLHFHQWLTPPYNPFSLSYLPMGLKGLLFSPGKSVFLYDPIILLAVPGLVLLWRHYRDWAVFVGVSFIGCLMVHAALDCFHGNCTWGPRYLMRQFPFLFIPIAFALFTMWQNVSKKFVCFGRGGLWAISIISILVQIVAVSGHHVRELYQLQQAYNVGWSDRQWTMFEPQANFLKIRLENLQQCVKEMANDQIEAWNTAPNYTLTIDQKLRAPVLHYLAFWPYHLTYYLPAVKPQYAVPLWAATTILVGGVLVGLAFFIIGYTSITKKE